MTWLDYNKKLLCTTDWQTMFVKHLPMEKKSGFIFDWVLQHSKKEAILINTARSADEIKGK